MGNYSGIWVPRGIMELAGMLLPDKNILSYIIGLSSQKGYCKESNSDIGKIFQMAPPNVSRIIDRLESAGTIRKIVIKQKGNERRLYPTINMIIAYYQYDTRPLLSKTQEGHINLIIASYQSDSSLYKEEKKESKYFPPTPPNASVEIFESTVFQSESFTEKNPPVADHPQLPPAWQSVAEEITGNEMCQMFAMRQVKGYQLETTYPTFESLLNEFIEGKRIKNEKPLWVDGNDIRDNFRDWVTKFLSKKRGQLNDQSHAANKSAHQPVFGISKGGRFQQGLQPPGVPPTADDFGTW